MGNGFDIGKAIYDIKGHLSTLEKFTKAAESASTGKTPFPPANEVMASLKSLNTLSGRLDNLALSGLGRPKEELIHVGEFSNPKERPGALGKLFNNMVALETAVEEGRQWTKQLDNLRSQADVKIAACQTAIQFFEKLIEYPVGNLGTAMQAQAFEYVLLFEKVQIGLSSVANAAKSAQGRILPDVTNLGTDLDNLRTTVRSVNVGGQATDAADNGLLPSRSEEPPIPLRTTVDVDTDGDKLPDQTQPAKGEMYPLDEGLLPSKSDGSSIPSRAAVDVDTDGDKLPDQTQPARAEMYPFDTNGVEHGERSWYDDALLQIRQLQQSEQVQTSGTYENQQPISYPDPDDPGPDMPPTGWGGANR